MKYTKLLHHIGRSKRYCSDFTVCRRDVVKQCNFSNTSSLYSSSFTRFLEQSTTRTGTLDRLKQGHIGEGNRATLEREGNRGIGISKKSSPKSILIWLNVPQLTNYTEIGTDRVPVTGKKHQYIEHPRPIPCAAKIIDRRCLAVCFL